MVQPTMMRFLSIFTHTVFDLLKYILSGSYRMNFIIRRKKKKEKCLTKPKKKNIQINSQILVRKVSYEFLGNY